MWLARLEPGHEASWERESCPLSGIEKRLPLGGYVSIKVMLNTIRNTTAVHCREAVLFSEGTLSEVRLRIAKKNLTSYCCSIILNVRE